MARLEVQEWGDPAGPAVVCAHGVTGHGARFRRLGEHLAGSRVIAVDLRGHGHSTWDAPWGADAHIGDLVETADSLGVGAATWMGHSFGGRLVADLARRHPDRVERAVLLARGGRVLPAHLPPEVRGAADDPFRAQTLEEVEKRHILHVLQHARDYDEAARVLGIDPTTLWRKRKRYGL